MMFMKNVLLVNIMALIFNFSKAALTMKQFESSLDMMRSICAPKFKVSTEILNNLRQGIFIEDPELKCYTKCIAQMAGTLSKKGEISAQKFLAQIDSLLPVELQQAARDAFDACKDIQKNYKDSCDKTFYSSKCAYEFDPKHFKFP